MIGVVFDTGALIAVDRADRRIELLVSEARSKRATVSIPAGCLAQAWRHPTRQARLGAFLRLPAVNVVALEQSDARRIGLLLAATDTTDVVDAHVALVALRLEQAVVTSDPDDLAILAPGIELFPV